MASTKTVTEAKASTSNGPQVVQEYIVKMPLNKSKKFNVMRFSGSQKVDVKTWTQVKMERENNLKEFKADEDQPKFGAGSEFGREQREESRRKKYGIMTKKYNPEDQPWLLKLNGKGGKKYKGIREGGVTENASYYVFTQAADGTFEAYPVAEWYNFTPIQRYKALSAEEAEEEFGRRDKVLNYFSIMVKKRLQKESIEEEDEDGEKPSGKKKNKKQAKDFKISDMDDWTKDSSESGDEDDVEENDEKSAKKNAKKGKKKKKEDVEDEGKEESDEGDFDDREVDYITGSSSSEEELEEEKVNREMKGVEDEEALRKLDNSEDEEETEENKETEENPEQEKAPEVEKKKKKKEGKGGDSSGDSSSDTSDSDFDDNKVHAVFMQKQAKKNGSDNSASSSRANTPTRLNAEGKGTKRKLNESLVSNKKPKSDNQSGSSSVNSLDGITEEAIRRYLSRKPMTATELLQKFKKTKVNSQQLVTKIADVLKKMDLVKRKIKDKMYLSLKS
ncbi:general transcription factor IIF subunit 1 isoform X1 [Parasteatoda tepidariorum]|uniref:general transcription factor IIF subunit 1 isoform X2 n=1 Tax=Parasteatoda tepidariorum TaxID=114398 RepID=UPI001C725886|nr:general transcription factor IIF subunit 1 isoform X2 [Parasteatoda tepidariorum]XP_042900057.1 general transcription factor IIF subunit 1 isoform X1 [Parasteatoda tepidariorum]